MLTINEGRSTLENEIVGDLVNEFGSTPDRPEDLPINDLSAAIQTSFNGQLGQQSLALVSRMISSKMPGGFNLNATRNYLESRWKFGPGLQDSILLLAVTMQPSSRLESETAATTFIDCTVDSYAALEGVSLSVPATTGGENPLGGMVVDPKALEHLTKQQESLSRQQLVVFARSLGVDLSTSEKTFLTSQESLKDLQLQIDLWHAEHGDFYASAIKPSFSPAKARIYTSSWNWVMQDILELFNSLINRRLSVGDKAVSEYYFRIINKSDSRLLDTILYFTNIVRRISSLTDVKDLFEQLYEDCTKRSRLDVAFRTTSQWHSPKTIIDVYGNIKYCEVPRPRSKAIVSLVQGSTTKQTAVYDGLARIPTQRTNALPRLSRTGTIPILHIRTQNERQWEYNKGLTAVYLESLTRGTQDGLSFSGKNVLLTGAGKGSIGVHLLTGLIAGGAKVIVTTSNYSPETTQFYSSIYSHHGARGSKLVVVPFNQGSQQDIEALCRYIFEPVKGLGWDLDHVIPFAAISEQDRKIDGIDSKSEFAHRLMLTNCIRLLGSLRKYKQKYGSRNRPGQIILPLSVNHGTFGHDGLYSESKAALETLFNRWHSEDWSQYLSICGASIGWTRGTNLMNSNDTLAEGIEAAGVRTFSQEEMGFAILCLMTPTMTRHCHLQPQYADLNGGLDAVSDFQELLLRVRQGITETSKIRKAIAKQQAIESAIITGPKQIDDHIKIELCPSARFEFPSLPDNRTEISPLREQLHGMVDLSRVVVVTGFSEVGPYGSSRTRWEMEAYGTFSIEGCIEMAWIMGLIKNHNGPLGGQHYTGWIDSRTNEAIKSGDVKRKYEKYILEHTGIRVIEPKILNNYDPHKKPMLHEVVIQEDLEPFEVSKEVAQDFKRSHGEKVDVTPINGSSECRIRLKSGAKLMIPKAMRFDNSVAGLVPTGWDARTYGISDDIISQVDTVTLYVLVSTIEALLSSGITDPYELYRYIHVSEVGNCIGSGIGGGTAWDKMHKGRYSPESENVQKDILQEAFINTMSAWVNMLLLSSSGPIRTPVGACATSLESLDLGVDTIVSGKAKFCLVGGFDDMTEGTSFEFANMKATVNAEQEFLKGRSPKEMSRPATTTRGGFVESHGCGLQVITTAELALSMGLPVYGVVAWTGTASDKISRSVPAPGSGILTNVREDVSGLPVPLIDLQTRRRRLDLRRRQIQSFRDLELSQLDQDVGFIIRQTPSIDVSEYIRKRKQCLDLECQQQQRDALYTLGNNFWNNDARISPIRGALAVWGLTVDDIGVASFHGTSTVMNEKNETNIVQQQLNQLGRAKGNPILGVFQKYLTGHPKGGAGAWMINGGLQILHTGLVPGNRNADDIDENLRKHEHIVFPNRSIQTTGVNAFTVTSFGFGQKGAQSILIHPKYLFATIDEDVYLAYVGRVEEREKKARRYFQHALANNSMFVAKDAPPYSADQESNVLLDPNARLNRHKKPTFTFTGAPSRMAA